jgi:transposase
LVFDHQGEYPTQWAAISSIADKSGMTRETLRRWVRQAETDSGSRPGPSTEDRKQIRELEREVRELRRANEILKAAAAFFGAELDRQPRR